MRARGHTRHLLTLVSILLVSALVRLWYISYAGGDVVLKPDSQGYYVEENFFGKRFLTHFINPNRTPGYTMVTSLAMQITGHDYPAYGTPTFINRLRMLAFIQTLISIASLVFLFDILRRVGISPSFSLAFTAFTGFNLYQFIWDRALLTESLYISLLLVLLWLFVRLLSAPSWRLLIPFIMLSSYEFLLRPAGLAVPFLLLPIVWLMHKTKQVLIMVVISLALYTLTPASILLGNRMLHNFGGISFNTDFSIFGRILLFDIPVDAAKKIKPLHTQVTEYKRMGGNVSIPWYFFVYYNNEIYGKLTDLQRFNQLVIKDQLPLFMRSVVLDIPKAFFDTDMYGVLYRSPMWSPARTFFDSLDWIIRILQKGTILFLLLAPLTLVLFIKKPTKIHAFLLAIVLIEIYQLFSSLVFGGAWEFARHMITTQTLLFFLCFWWIAKTLSWLYNKR